MEICKKDAEKRDKIEREWKNAVAKNQIKIQGVTVIILYKQDDIVMIP